MHNTKYLSEEILDKTMNLFWEKGFSNTLVDDLITISYLRKLFHTLLKDTAIKKNNKKMNNTSSADFLVGNVFGVMTLRRTSAPKAVFENRIAGIMDFLSFVSSKKFTKTNRRSSTNKGSYL